jgi:putative tricarboxylic transport membrane protein
MTQKGQPGRAVWLGIWSSFLGGLLSGVFLIGATGWFAAIALEFGPWEYFSLFVFALSMVAGLTEGSLVKGLLSGAIGLVITIIGSDPIMSVPRFTLGSDFLRNGFPFLPVLIGIFAFAPFASKSQQAAANDVLSTSVLAVLVPVNSRRNLVASLS